MSIVGAFGLALVLVIFCHARKYASNQFEYWLGIATMCGLYGLAKVSWWLLAGGS